MITSLLDALPIPALIVGPDERLVKLNAAAQAMFGAGVESRHYVTALRQPALMDAVEAALRLNRQAQTSYGSTEASREMTWQATAAPVVLPQGQGVLVTFQDTTPLREAGQMRRDFVANVSHELRTPLTALLGFIETLRGAARDDPAARERFLSIMEREAAPMNRLVRDLLSLSRVEAEERIRPTSTVDIVGLVGSVVATFAPYAKERRVEISVDAAPSLPPIPGDADQLLQVLTNLIENAVKYGGSGGKVQITVMRTDKDPSLRGPSVTVRVADTGDGIEAVHIPRLTERFYRVDSHRSRELGGTGLGLAIVKHIVNRHRGRLRIESTVGEGTVISVSLPMERSTASG